MLTLYTATQTKHFYLVFSIFEFIIVCCCCFCGFVVFAAVVATHTLIIDVPTPVLGLTHTVHSTTVGSVVTPVSISIQFSPPTSSMGSSVMYYLATYRVAPVSDDSIEVQLICK